MLRPTPELEGKSEKLGLLNVLKSRFGPAECNDKV
jgi:hypothetical protein